jgi:hypothetical protein
MRPIRNERGQMIDTCYLCERETKQENDWTVIEKLRTRGRDPEKEAPISQSPSLKRRAAKGKKKK